MGGLVFCAPAESETGTQPHEIRPMGFAVSRGAQAEEGMVLHCTFPEMLTGSGAVQSEYKSVLLLPALIIIFYHHQGQFALFKIHFGDFGPKE